MSTIHVFQCGGGSPYGFTNDRNGANLPQSECEGGWEFFKTLQSEPFDLPRISVDIEKVRVDRGGRVTRSFPGALRPVRSAEKSPAGFA